MYKTRENLSSGPPPLPELARGASKQQISSALVSGLLSRAVMQTVSPTQLGGYTMLPCSDWPFYGPPLFPLSLFLSLYLSISPCRRSLHLSLCL